MEEGNKKTKQKPATAQSSTLRLKSQAGLRTSTFIFSVCSHSNGHFQMRSRKKEEKEITREKSKLITTKWKTMCYSVLVHYGLEMEAVTG